MGICVVPTFWLLGTVLIETRTSFEHLSSILWGTYLGPGLPALMGILGDLFSPAAALFLVPTGNS